MDNQKQKIKGQKYFKNKGVVTGVRRSKMVDDFVLMLIVGEASFIGVMETETKMQWADWKVGDMDSCILWLLA